MKVLACVLIFVVVVFAEEQAAKKDKRGLLGLGYGYGHGLEYVPTVVSSPAVSYAKVSLSPGLGYGHGLYGYGYDHSLGYGSYGLGYGHGLGYGVGYKTVHYAPTYSYYGGLNGYYGHGYGHYGYY